MIKCDDHDHKLLNFKRVLDTFLLNGPLSNIPHHFKSQHTVTLLKVDILVKTILGSDPYILSFISTSDFFLSVLHNVCDFFSAFM